MRNLYQEQKNRQMNHEWEDFRQHQYDCFSVATVGDIVDMPYGEKATLVHKETGIVTPLDEDLPTDEYEEQTLDAKLYVFKDDDGIYNTYVFIGDYIVYDFPDIHEYHHKKMLEIDPNDYKIGGRYETTYEYKEGEQ